jgi:hypothetical protein
MPSPGRIFLLTSSVALLSGCAAGIPKEALQLTPESLAARQMQTRRFDSSDEKALLAAGGAVLQDLGFILKTSEPGLGVLVADKHRTAVEAKQVVPAIVFSILLSVLAQQAVDIPWDRHQLITSALVTHPSGAGDTATFVRVTFHRTVWNTRNQVSKMERLDEPAFYEEFFQKLSKSVFLEAQQVP